MADSCWLVLVLVWLVWAWRRCQHPQSRTVAAPLTRLFKPRTPHDCPACRQQRTVPASDAPPCPPVTPWRHGKSRRSAPKRMNTQGFGCPNRTCVFYQITEAHLHALVGDGAHGRCERIQTLRCQACKTTFSTRRDTPLSRLKTASQRGVNADV